MPDQLEGSNPVLEALRAGRPVNKILLSKDTGRHRALAQIIHLAKQNGIVVESVDRSALDRVSQTRRHQGVIAYISAQKYFELEEILARAKGEPAFLVLLDGVEDPHNLGAILRTADGAGAQGIIIPKRRAAGLTPAVARVSAGAIEYVPVCRESSIIATIDELKKKKIWVVGIDRAPCAEALRCTVESHKYKSYNEADFTLPTALVLGGEDKGLSEAVRKHCDLTVSIPMLGKISSLNVSVSAAIVMYEVVRQRMKKG